MKRVLPILALLVASATNLLGQGRVLFNNYSTAPPFNPIWTWSGIGGQSNNVGANFFVQLTWAAGTFANQVAFDQANPNTFSPTSFFGTTGGSPETDGAGLFDGGTIPIGPAGTYTMQVRGWISTYPTYNAARGSGTPYLGTSQLFTMDVTAAPIEALSTVFPSFAIWWVPEPAPVAFAGMGLVALWLSRRSKRQ